MNTAAPPSRVSSRSSPPYRPFPAEALVLVLIVLTIGCLIAVGAWYRQKMLSAGSGAELTHSEATGIVARGSRLLGLPEDGKSGIWSERLAAGQAALGDYLLRALTSPAYLANQGDDRVFLADASRIMTGTTADDAALSRAEAVINETGSRLAGLNSLLEDFGFSGSIRLPADTTRIRTLTLANDRPPAGSETVGILTLSAEARLTGRKAVFRLYSDGRLHSTKSIDSPDPTVQSQYAINWDTRQENTGSHNLDLLVQSSDGRGVWLDLESYSVPEITTLAAGQSVDGQAEAGLSKWYSLPVSDGQALLTVAETGRTIGLSMFDLHAREIASTLAIPGQPAALRARLDSQEPGQGICYVKISAEENTGYQMIAALAAARPTDGSVRLLAVQAINGDQVLITVGDGEATWQPAADYEIYDATARLSQLALTLPDGQDAGYVNGFDPDTGLYGLVVDAATSQLQLSALAMEGSAANLSVELIDEQNTAVSLSANGIVPLALSENRLRITVTGFDSSTRVYEVNILRPPHSTGYHLTLGQFPGSYQSPLWLLHLQHPAWQFRALNTGLDWAAFIAAEDVEDRSLVSASSSPDSWIEPGSPVYDGTSWKAAAVRVIEHFADPRNFLNEVDVFQFEKMVYDPAIHNRSGLASIIGNSFMADGNAQNIDYTSLLISAGETANISPYYLAAKIIQEVGRTGESPLATGILPNYEGFYNLYNIGATPNPDIADGALINGARFAQYGRKPDEMEITAEEAVWLIPWNTPERAITGGAIWIAQRYIQIGQDTLYLQKFDLIDDGSLYTHQYAQNIQMAWSEARNTRKAYAGTGLLDEAFVFEIPVFAGMPTEAQTLP